MPKVKKRLFVETSHNVNPPKSKKARKTEEVTQSIPFPFYNLPRDLDPTIYSFLLASDISKAARTSKLFYSNMNFLTHFTAPCSFTDNDLIKLIKNCPNIAYLDLSKCKKIITKSTEFISRLRKLETLKLEGSHQIDNQVFKKIAQNCLLL